MQRALGCPTTLIDQSEAQRCCLTTPIDRSEGVVTGAVRSCTLTEALTTLARTLTTLARTLTTLARSPWTSK